MLKTTFSKRNEIAKHRKDLWRLSKARKHIVRSHWFTIEKILVYHREKIKYRSNFRNLQLIERQTRFCLKVLLF